MNPLKVGDKVKVIGKTGNITHYATIGSIGTVVEQETKSRVAVKFVDFNQTIDAVDLELVQQFKVGDTVKLTIADGSMPYYGWGGVENGEIGEVVNVCSDGSLYVNFPDFDDWHGLPSEFTLVTEEPTPVKVQQFKAGDKVTLLDGGGDWPLHGYTDGQEYTIKAMPDDHPYHKGMDYIMLTGGYAKGIAGDAGYARADQLALVDDTASEIAELRSELTRLSERLDQLEQRQLPAMITDFKTYTACVSETVMSADEIRAKIVADAMDEIKRLSNSRKDNVVNLRGRFEEFNPVAYDEVEFIVNREKRTVVALIRYNDTKKTWAKGVAKCEPDDVFNEHIGKVIALNRALGITVPEKYVCVPQPTLAQIGDIAQGLNTKRTFKVERYEDQYDGRKAFGTYIEDGNDAYVPQHHYRIIDDSNREVR